MRKGKILSVLLCVCVIFLFSLPISAVGQVSEEQTNPREGDETLAENAVFEEPVASDCSTENVVAGQLNIFDVLGEDIPVFTAYGDPSLLQDYTSVPEEILLLDTEELLDFFLKSPYMFSKSGFLSSSFTATHSASDFSEHPAFRELLTRKDFILALVKYGNSLTESSSILEIRAFQAFKEQPKVKEIISNSTEEQLAYSTASASIGD